MQNVKKIIFLFVFLVLISSCTNLYNTDNKVSYDIKVDRDKIHIFNNAYMNIKGDYKTVNGFLVEGDYEYTLDRTGISMNPCITSKDVVIYEKPKTTSDIREGDWVRFRVSTISGIKTVLHSIYSINKDEKGIYYKTKGLNENLDYSKIRFENIEYVVVAVIK